MEPPRGERHGSSLAVFGSPVGGLAALVSLGRGGIVFGHLRAGSLVGRSREGESARETLRLANIRHEMGVEFRRAAVAVTEKFLYRERWEDPECCRREAVTKGMEAQFGKLSDIAGTKEAPSQSAAIDMSSEAIAKDEALGVGGGGTA